MHPDADVLEVDPVTGRRTGLGAYARRVLETLRRSDVPYALVGAAALAVRGLPRMTRHVDVVVLLEDAFAALEALEGAGFRSITPVVRREEPEPMYVLKDAEGNEVDVLVAAGDLARIVTETNVDLVAVERYLADVHAEMLPVLHERVQMARHPAPPPPRPPRRR